ncbi:NHL repeat-containing protein, partial [candidate division KSB1 bacterium]|nr:NHL repeat-containing protein [candidate division KSB1 bacterium]
MRNLFTIALAVLIAFSCSKTETTYTVETIDGVRYVHNTAPLWGDETKIEIEFVQKIGDIDAVDENFQFYNPFEVVRDNEGFIYLMDSGNNRIQKFDSDGKFVQTIGRKGQGPVEFEFPMSLNIDKDSNLVINDMGNNRAQVISKDGKYIDFVNLAGTPFYLRVLKSNNFVTQSTSSLLQIFDRDEKDWKPKLLTLLDPEGKFIKRFVELKNFEESQSNIVNQSGNTMTFEIDNDDNIYVEFWFQNRIDVYTPEGSLKTVISRDLDFDLEFNTTIRLMRGPDPDTPVEMPIADFSEVSTKGLGIDNKGRLWLPTYRRQRNPDNEDDIYTAKDLRVLEIYDMEGLL